MTTPARGRRVGVTGIGVVSPFGDDARLFWDALGAGRCGIRANDFLPDRLPGVRSAAFVQGYDPGRHFSPAEEGRYAAFTQFAIVAAREAVRDAGLELPVPNGERAAILIGTSSGGIDAQEEAYRRLLERNLSTVSPTTVMRGMYNAPASQLSIDFGIRGPVLCTSTACSSAGHAIALSFWLLRSGVVDVAVCGGAETVRNFGMLKAWEAMRVLSKGGLCRPFDARRDGCVLGEGAGIVVLEDLEGARRRGATVYCEMVGAGMSSDARDLIMPDVEGSSLAMRSALSDAGLAPGDIDHINAHGTGTERNDLVEAEAIGAVFGAHAPAIAVSATKSMHGHALGAAGALEFAATCLAVHHQKVPPTINVEEIDPRCPVTLVGGAAEARPIRAAMSNSLAFGGLNASLVVARAED
jgi:nodulation protein E